jgi:hypothetical protein
MKSVYSRIGAIVAALLLLSSCGSSSEKVTCAPARGLEAACVFHITSEGNCGDTSTTAECRSGSYVCPEGTLPASQCTSFGPPQDADVDSRASDGPVVD